MHSCTHLVLLVLYDIPRPERFPIKQCIILVWALAWTCPYVAQTKGSVLLAYCYAYCFGPLLQPATATSDGTTIACIMAPPTAHGKHGNAMCGGCPTSHCSNCFLQHTRTTCLYAAYRSLMWSASSVTVLWRSWGCTTPSDAWHAHDKNGPSRDHSHRC